MIRWIPTGAAFLCLCGVIAAPEIASQLSDPYVRASADVPRKQEIAQDGRVKHHPFDSANAIERGRYLVKIGGCNDCHTPGYLEKAGDVPEDRWLIGAPLGFNGPWGTTYPANLRRLLHTMREDEWVEYASTIKTRPPMPWFNLSAMNEADLRAMYRYVRSLPANDSSVPDYVPPGSHPQTPYIVFVPQMPKP
jgi:mono/diheme cytochrome c family protein